MVRSKAVVLRILKPDFLGRQGLFGEDEVAGMPPVEDPFPKVNELAPQGRLLPAICP